MTEIALFGGLIAAVYIAAGLSFFALLFVTAPYGRHTRPGWGPTVSSRTGWVLMESPAVIAFALIYAMGDLRADCGGKAKSHRSHAARGQP